MKSWIVANILLSDGEFPIAETESFLDTGLIDSLGVMELVMYVRTEYRVDVAPLEVTPENFDSINGVTRYIERKLAVADLNTREMAAA